LNVTSPANGSVYYINGTMPINWSNTGTVGATQFNYSADGGADGYNHSILNGTEGTDFNQNGSYTWTIPDTMDIGSLIRIKLYSAPTTVFASFERKHGGDKHPQKLLILNFQLPNKLKTTIFLPAKGRSKRSPGEVHITPPFNFKNPPTIVGGFCFRAFTFL